MVTVAHEPEFRAMGVVVYAVAKEDRVERTNK